MLKAQVDGLGSLQVAIVVERAARCELYSYFRSSASFRVRIALALKGLDVRVRAGAPGQERAAAASRIARASAPCRAWCRLLERRRPDADAVAGDHRVPRRDASRAAAAARRRRPAARACARSRSTSPARSIRSNNLRVLRYLVRELKVSEDDKNRWYRHWVETGLEAVERQLAAHRRPAASATATRRPWPTACWCRRSSMRSAWTAGSTTCRP